MARSESLQNLLWLNIRELSVIKNVTANYLKRVIFFSFTTLQYTKNTLFTSAKINLKSEKLSFLLLIYIFLRGEHWLSISFVNYDITFKSRPKNRTIKFQK